MIFKVAILAITSSIIGPAFAINPPRSHSPTSYLEASDTISIRYFDPSRERRTPRSIGDIDTSFDIESTVICYGLTCRSGLRIIPAALQTATQRSSCSEPIYARIQLRHGTNLIETFYVGHSGRCLSTSGRSYRLDVDLLRQLATNPVNQW